MEKEEVSEVLSEYRDANSAKKLVELLKQRLIGELDKMPAETDRQRHELNLLIRDLEEQLDWIENEKLAEFDPEQR
ncbi:MAG: hypothetical protein ABEJ98_04730 [Candidatus Nanohaloarchaea archaeon]